MPARSQFDWNGDDFIQHVEQAAREAINETVDAARDDAALSHEWVNRTMQLEEEIVSEHADPDARNPSAKFGTTRRRGFVGLFHEEGTVHEYERPFIRPAADRQFPTFVERIRRRRLA
jgi:hypothetical protein